MTASIADKLEIKVGEFLTDCVAAFDILRSKKWSKAKSLPVADLRREIGARGGTPVEEGGKPALVVQLESLAGVLAGGQIERRALELVTIASLSDVQVKRELQVRHDDWEEQHEGGGNSPYAFTDIMARSVLVAKLERDVIAGVVGRKVEKKYQPVQASRSVVIRHSILANLVCFPSEARRSGALIRFYEGVWERVVQPFKQKYQSGASRGEFLVPMARRVSRAGFLNHVSLLSHQRIASLTIHSAGSVAAATTAFCSLDTFRYVRVSAGGSATARGIVIRIDPEQVRQPKLTIAVWWFLLFVFAASHGCEVNLNLDLFHVAAIYTGHNSADRNARRHARRPCCWSDDAPLLPVLSNADAHVIFPDSGR